MPVSAGILRGRRLHRRHSSPRRRAAASSAVTACRQLAPAGRHGVLRADRLGRSGRISPQAAERPSRHGDNRCIAEILRPLRSRTRNVLTWRHPRQLLTYRPFGDIGTALEQSGFFWPFILATSVPCGRIRRRGACLIRLWARAMRPSATTNRLQRRSAQGRGQVPPAGLQKRHAMVMGSGGALT